MTFTITSEELQRAFDEFAARGLRATDFVADRMVLDVMCKHTREDPKISAGCEVGIKLGLLITERRRVDLQAK
jgi:hypothetical protein